mmetsp:Transcript_13063/g.19716  ORF Transcript_13063/g.19716 Transcript_13063/m.19716 type:complete len:381 (+) Transcript_13063:84-1226(+)
MYDLMMDRIRQENYDFIRNRSRSRSRHRPPKKRTISSSEWLEKMKLVSVNSSEMNAIIFDYLIVEGYVDAARSFAEEASMDISSINFDAISRRVRVRSLIQEGNMDAALLELAEMNPSILEDDELHFQLKQQQVIELIRKNDIDGALALTQESLTPHGLKNERFLEAIERTMSLLTFHDAENVLLHPNHKTLTASLTNSAILASSGEFPQPKLPSLLNLLDWAQQRCSESFHFPKMINFENGSLDLQKSSSSSSLSTESFHFMEDFDHPFVSSTDNAPIVDDDSDEHIQIVLDNLSYNADDNISSPLLTSTFDDDDDDDYDDDDMDDDEDNNNNNDDDNDNDSDDSDDDDNNDDDDEEEVTTPKNESPASQPSGSFLKLF